MLRKCEQSVSGKAAEFPARAPAYYPRAIQNYPPGRLLLTTVTPRFAVKNSFFLPITQSLGIAVAAKWRFLKAVLSNLKTGLRSTCIFCGAHVYFYPPCKHRGEVFWGSIAALAGNNSRLGGCATAEIQSAGLSPWVSVWWWEVLLWVPFQLVLSLKKWRPFPTPPVPFALLQVWAIPVCLFHKAKPWGSWRPSKRTLPPSFPAHSSLDQIHLFCRDFGFSWEVEVSLLSAHWFLPSCIKSQNQVQVPFFFLEKNWR